MAIAQQVAGYTLAEADLLRRAMGKRRRSILDREYVPFAERMEGNGFSAAAITALWDDLVRFSNFAICKAHVDAYGRVSYWAAYLKANYPAEYMAALLTSASERDRPTSLRECRRLGITVLPPDVNASAAVFTAAGSDVRFGLSGVRGVKEDLADAIVAAREEMGAFTSFADFLEKVTPGVGGRRSFVPAVDALIKAGAFDSLGHTRSSLAAVYEQAIAEIREVPANADAGLNSLLDGHVPDGAASTALLVTVPDVPEWEMPQKLAFEREVLGLYVSDHPLAGAAHVRDSGAAFSISAVEDEGRFPEKSTVTIAGVITSVARKVSKNGTPWCIISLEDFEGSIEVPFFSETYDAYRTALVEDAIVTVKGTIRRRESEVWLTASELSLLDWEGSD